MKNTITIIGSGFSALAASCYLANEGFDVTILEKNNTVGGRARQLVKEGFTFDIGPTWYWMPDVFEKFFADFDKKPSDYYHLDKLNPAYEVYFDKVDSIKIPDNLSEILTIFEKEETGSAAHLQSFLDNAEKFSLTSFSFFSFSNRLIVFAKVALSVITEIFTFFFGSEFSVC